ncbi:CLUMA_CG008071, isoform A [Clunio marinus]|uniref:CLUMA_CG008071, isoform A n=1 Tax=Clunio marinus TaxID=568069 RepID=A0A1J1I486_9DIPT|nr:CLUMA_CG008071, isoform A [Clunio marinus]
MDRRIKMESPTISSCFFGGGGLTVSSRSKGNYFRNVQLNDYS